MQTLLGMMTQTLQHAQTTITCSRASQSNDKLAATRFPGVHHQLTHAIACGDQRIAQFRLYLGQADSLCHLDDGFAVLDTKVSIRPSHHRVVDVAVQYLVGVHRAQEALATVAGFYLLYLHITMLCLQSFGARFICLLAAHATLETVKYQ